MILVVGAMPQETAGLGKQGETLMLGDTRVDVYSVGVGKVMSSMNTQKLIDRLQPDAVIMAGVAGGVNPELAIGDVVIGRETIQHDLDAVALGIPRGTVPFTEYRWLQADSRLLMAAEKLTPPQSDDYDRQCGRLARLISGRILSGDQFMTRAIQQRSPHLRGELAGDAVDMESAAVALVCVCNQIPHLVIRVISDTADGKAKVDFSRFLPMAGKVLAQLVKELVINYSSQLEKEKEQEK